MKRLLRRRPSPALVISCIALFVALAPAAYGTHLGALLLGHSNTANNTTALTGAASATTGKPMLQVTNTSTKAGATALDLDVAAGKPPFRVNSGAKVTNLNADRLDGIDSSQLERTGLIRSARVDQSEAQGFLNIFRWPEFGVFLTADGDADRDGSFIVWNDRASGTIEVIRPSQSTTGIPPGGSAVVSNPSGMITVLIAANGDATRSFVVTCAGVTIDPGGVADELLCQGVGNRTN
jgi:hypothetical protein